jgi:hypothetical protein
LRVLRPAESAARRLIFLAARGLAVKPVPMRTMPQRPMAGKGGPKRVAFQLFDPRKRFTQSPPRREAFQALPRISVPDRDPRVAALWSEAPPAALPQPLPGDHGLIDAAPLSIRLQALKAALEDVPRQALRLVRWRARRERAQAKRFTFASPLRPGLPPGYRRSPTHDVDDILIYCHGLARDAMRHDTS